VSNRATSRSWCGISRTPTIPTAVRPHTGSRRTCSHVFDAFLALCESRMANDDMAPVTHERCSSVSGSGLPRAADARFHASSSRVGPPDRTPRRSTSCRSAGHKPHPGTGLAVANPRHRRWSVSAWGISSAGRSDGRRRRLTDSSQLSCGHRRSEKSKYHSDEASAQADGGKRDLVSRRYSRYAAKAAATFR
jgi:hypothetical protein